MADEFIHVINIGREKFGLRFGRLFTIRGVRPVWPMSEQHGIVNEKWFRLVAADEVDEKCVDGVRPIFCGGAFAVGLNVPFEVAFARFGMPGFHSRPHAMFVKAVL